jgi:putative endonuclease
MSLRGLKGRGNLKNNTNKECDSKLKTYYVYIMTNKNNTVLYTGVSGNIHQRLQDHTSGRNATSFTKKYNINKLVYVESTVSIEAALNYEKKIKSWSRQKKIDLIELNNPKWEDLGMKYGISH